MKKYIFILLTLFIISVLFSESDGTAGFQQLKNYASTAAIGQAGTGEFSSDSDAFMVLINPTSLIHFNNKIISETYQHGIMDLSNIFLGYVNSNGNKSTGIILRYFDYNKIERRDDIGDLIGEYHPFDIMATTNFGFRILPVHYVGINLSLLYEKLDTSSSYGVSTDLGYLYLSPIKGLRFAATIKNIGITSKMDNERVKLPLHISISSIKDFNLSTVPISSELTLIKYSDDDEIKINYGINAIIKKILTLRLGYKLNYSSENFSAGIGIRIKKIRLDYSFVPYSNNLGNTNQISLNYIF